MQVKIFCSNFVTFVFKFLLNGKFLKLFGLFLHILLFLFNVFFLVLIKYLQLSNILSKMTLKRLRSVNCWNSLILLQTHWGTGFDINGGKFQLVLMHLCIVVTCIIIFKANHENNFQLWKLMFWITIY